VQQRLHSLSDQPARTRCRGAGAILFLHQDTRNEIAPLTDRKEIWQRLLATLIRPMVTAEWWQKELDVLEQIVKEVRCYSMKFDKSGAIVEKLVELTKG
jgi:hypothetical protein